MDGCLAGSLGASATWYGLRMVQTPDWQLALTPCSKRCGATAFCGSKRVIFVSEHEWVVRKQQQVVKNSPN
jgi:hypothetical protein